VRRRSLSLGLAVELLGLLALADDTANPPLPMVMMNSLTAALCGSGKTYTASILLSKDSGIAGDFDRADVAADGGMNLGVLERHRHLLLFQLGHERATAGGFLGGCDGVAAATSENQSSSLPAGRALRGEPEPPARPDGNGVIPRTDFMHIRKECRGPQAKEQGSADKGRIAESGS